MGGGGGRGKNTYGHNAHTNEQEERRKRIPAGVRSGLRGSFERGCFPASNSETRSKGESLQQHFHSAQSWQQFGAGIFVTATATLFLFSFFEHLRIFQFDPLDANSSKNPLLFLFPTLFMHCTAMRSSSLCRFKAASPLCWSHPRI